VIELREHLARASGLVGLEAGGPGQSRKLGEQVTRYLRDALVSGVFRGGSRLRIDELSTQLGVSTMPVREALITLANEGLLEMLPRRGFRVAPMRQNDIRDSFKVHAFVAGLLAEEAARVIGGETIRELREIDASTAAIVRRSTKIRERSAAVEQLNFVFHRRINWIPDAGRLRWFLRAASRYVPRHFYEDIPGWIDATVSDHPRIIDALEQHDGAQARALMEEHVHRAGELVLANLARQASRDEESRAGEVPASDVTALAADSGQSDRSVRAKAIDHSGVSDLPSLAAGAAADEDQRVPEVTSLPRVCVVSQRSLADAMGIADDQVM